MAFSMRTPFMVPAASPPLPLLGMSDAARRAREVFELAAMCTTPVLVVAEAGSRPGGGNALPSPPECVQEYGGSQGTRVESRRIDEDVESCSHQQFDRKSAHSRQF